MHYPYENINDVDNKETNNLPKMNSVIKEYNHNIQSGNLEMTLSKEIYNISNNITIK